MLTHSFSTTNNLYSELDRQTYFKDESIISARTKLISKSPLVYEVSRSVDLPLGLALRTVFSIPNHATIVSQITVSDDGKKATCITRIPESLRYLADVEEVICLKQIDDGSCKGKLQVLGESSAPEWATNVVLRTYKQHRLKHFGCKGHEMEMTREAFIKKLAK